MISTTQQAFEAFLANNNPFDDLGQCMVFLSNIKDEKYRLDEDFLPDMSVDEVHERLRKTFLEYKDEYDEVLLKYLSRQNQRTLNRFYFKNNIYSFSALPKIRRKLDTIFMKVDEFKDPGNVPKEIKSNIEDLWAYYKDFVFYNHSPFQRIDRLFHYKRKNVVTVDTDSNMLNLNHWVIFVYKYIISVNDELKDRDPNELRFIAINTMCYMITAMVTDVLKRYTKDANIPKSFRPMINMKNEFLFTRLMLTDKKKRYVSSTRLREGSEIYPEKIDVKGLDFMKSSTREETKQFFTNLVKTKILQADEIDVPSILRSLEEFEQVIIDSLHKGERSFLIPKSVKELEAYDDPFKEQGVRGVMVWNYVYPEQQIELPEKLDIIKVNLDTIEKAEALKEIDENIFNILEENIFNSKHEKVRSKGVQVIALPRNVPKIPDWIIPFIDYDTIANDNLNRFGSVLASLDIQTIRASKKEYFTNILTV